MLNGVTLGTIRLGRVRMKVEEVIGLNMLSANYNRQDLTLGGRYL